MTNPAKKGTRPRQSKRRFSDEFKTEAVRLLRERQRQNVSATQVARELGIGPGLLCEWVRRYEEAATGAAGTAGQDETLEDEVRRLRREVTILRQEREFAKKAAAFFAKESL